MSEVQAGAAGPLVLSVDFGNNADEFGEVGRALKVSRDVEGPGCVLTYKPSPRRLGMTAQEQVINVALSLSTGVSASLVANWLWERWGKRGERALRVGGVRLWSPEDIVSCMAQSYPQLREIPEVASGLHIRRVQIPEFRNLRDLDIAFDAYTTEQHLSGLTRRVRSHAIIGQNGTGKSNFIEALITIFRDIDLDNDAAFEYTLDYDIGGRAVRIQSIQKDEKKKQKRPYVWVDGEARTQGYLLKNRELLPSHVFAYYSGRNERIEQLFQEHQRRFNLRQEITTDEVLPEHVLAGYNATDAQIRAIDDARKRREARMREAGDDRLRRLFYCRGGHSQLVLLSCLLREDPVFAKVLDNLHIESLESALFVLKEPHKLREKRRNGRFEAHEINEGDRRFWFARGNVVAEFLDKLWKVAWAPIEQEAEKQIDFRGRRERQRQLYLFVPSQEKLQALGAELGGTDSFFRYAEGAYIGDLIEEVRINVKKRDEHGGKVSFTQLSEGELQMLTVLGLMRITRDDRCLFLLDEPDTHLNPIWKLRYFDDIDGVLDSESEGRGANGSQIIITTHDPMMIGSLKREQVRILKRHGSRTSVEMPDEHPQGMGVTGLLKSELFGLSSTLDVETERRLLRRNELFVKSPRTQAEDAQLSRLSAQLSDLGFSNADFRDPDYALFVRKMAQHRRSSVPPFTQEELQAQDRIADEIIDEIMRGEGDR
jgi:predicted ATPase